ncbi:MAG: ribosome silencing factor [Rhodospirillaceae bacterium]
MSAEREAHTLEKKAKRGNAKAVPADTLLTAILKSLDDHKAEEVVVIDLKGKSDIADFMVIASGRSSRQVATMADNILQEIKPLGVVGVTPEGLTQGDWVLLDAGDVIVHLFRPEVRTFYNLEKMWNVEIPDAQETARL